MDLPKKLKVKYDVNVYSLNRDREEVCLRHGRFYSLKEAQNYSIELTKDGLRKVEIRKVESE